MTREKAHEILSSTMADVDDDQGNRYITYCYWLNLLGILIVSTILGIASCCVAKNGKG